MFMRIIIFSLLFVFVPAHAALKLSELALLLDQTIGQKEITISNTDDIPFILAVSFTEKDSGIGNVFFTPSVARVNPKQKQTVRFMISKKENLDTQVLRFVSFASIPKTATEQGVNLILNQEIPLIINPAGLPINDSPWKLLTANREGNKVLLHNNSKYVVRIDDNFNSLPSNKVHLLPRPYMLAMESLEINIPTNDTKLVIQPKLLSGVFTKEKHTISVN